MDRIVTFLDDRIQSSMVMLLETNFHFIFIQLSKANVFCLFLYTTFLRLFFSFELFQPEINLLGLGSNYGYLSSQRKNNLDKSNQTRLSLLPVSFPDLPQFLRRKINVLMNVYNLLLFFFFYYSQVRLFTYLVKINYPFLCLGNVKN